MKTIVLITRENGERAAYVSVFLCNSYGEARNFRRFVKRLSLAGENKLVARIITANAEYSLEKYQPMEFDDFVKIDDRKIQRVMRELDSQMLAVALNGAKEEVKDVFFRNMSKRAASMLKEDMEYSGPVNEADIENARHITLDIFEDVNIETPKFDEAWEQYKKLKEYRKKQENSGGENHIVLVFRGAETDADFVSVYLFDEEDDAEIFCNYLNYLEPDKESFLYAKYAEQMTEYETKKPALVSFDKIFKYSGRYDIFREALKKFDPRTILSAFKGMDKHSRTLIMQYLPTKTTDEINEMIKRPDKNCNDLFSLSETRQAQQRILDALNKTAEKFRESGFVGVEILKA